MAIATRAKYTLDELIAELEIQAQAMDDLPIARDLEQEITSVMYAGIQQNYNLSATAWGMAWAPHAPSTIARYGPHPLLILTGAMEAASTSSGVRGNYLEVNDRSVVIGVDLPYAAAQQYGTDKIPARPFFDLPDEAIADLEDLAVGYYSREVFG